MSRRAHRTGVRIALVAYALLTVVGIAWAQDFWAMCDDWAGRFLLFMAVLAAIAGPIAAWFKLDRRVGGVEDHQRLTDQKLDEVCEDVDEIKRTMNGKLDRILVLLERYFEGR